MSKKHLTIELSNNDVHFVVLQNGIVVLRHYILFPNSNEIEIKELLSSKLTELDLNTDSVHEITLSWSSPNSTLVPNSIFLNSNEREIYSLCFGKVNDGSVDYNRIPEQSLVNIYSIPDWVKRFFVIKFPRVIIQHTGSHSIRTLLNQEAFKLKVLVDIKTDFFTVIISKHNELQFYSHFEYQTIDDIIYHLVFTLQQKELTKESGKLIISTFSSFSTENLEALKKAFNSINEFNQFNPIESKDFIAKAQLLCV